MGCSRDSARPRADALEDCKLVLKRDLAPALPDYNASVDGAGTVSFKSPGCTQNAPGWTVPLATVEELRSILDPMAKIVKGYKPSMPKFRGKLRRQQLRDLTAYLKQRSERVDAGR
jgi:hypothetical protein